MNQTIDYSPLATYSKLLLFFRLIRRIRMIIVRVAIVLALVALIVGMIWLYNLANQIVGQPPGEVASSETYNYSFSSSGESNGAGLVIWLLIAGLIAQWLLTLAAMSTAWDKFARVNGFTAMDGSDLEAWQEATTVPSFEGKWFKSGLPPIAGIYAGHQFSLHTRQYKEGGLFRWRELQMDTVLTLTIPATLPHIVINALGNERARQSNMSKTYPTKDHFQFEGSMGTKYDVYVKPESRIIALQLFTPDVLQKMYDTLPSADIELLGDKLWIVQRYGVLDDKLARTMFEAADSLYGELDKQIRTAGLMVSSSNTSVQ